MRVKRNVYTRNTYEFRLPYSYSYLECMDVLYITTSSQWAAGINNANLNIVNLPVRITKIVDNPGQDGLEFTAEDYPFGVHQPTIFNKDLSAGEVQANMFADPGDTQAILFEATNRLTLQQGNQIWMGALGSDENWGGCNVWVSQDGVTYKQIGAINTPARLGALVSSFATGTDPDTTHSLVVQLAENCQPLEAGTTADADNGNLLCFVDGEVISYSACTVTGQEQYTMGTYIRRGQMGSTIGTHAIGSLFLRLDESIFKFTYDPTWAGKTLFIKFQSFNAFGNKPQDLSDLTPVSFTVPGLSPGTIDASTGLLLGPAGVLDNIRDGTTYVKNAGQFGQNLLENPSFEVPALAGSGDIAAGWFEAGSGGILHSSIQNASLAFSGNACYEVNIAGSAVLANGASWTTTIRNRKAIPVYPGQKLTLRGYVKATISGLPSGVVSRCFFQVRQFYSDGSADFSAGLVTGDLSANTSWTPVSVGPCTMPTPVGKTIVSVSFEMQVQLTNSSGAPQTINGGTMNAGAFFDNVELVRVSDLDSEVVDGVTYARPLSSRLSSGKPLIDFSEGIHLNKVLDNVADSTTRFAQTAGGLTYRPTSNPLSATDAGSNDTVSIAAFTMRCTGHADVSVSSGSITALSRSTLYYIYYDDATLAGGAVTFNAATTKETALNGAGRFFVGSITTPVASGAATVGNNDGGVGAQGGGTSVFLFGAVAQVNTVPTSITISNPTKCFDGDTSTFANIAKNNLSSTSDGSLTVSAMSPSSAPWQSLTLKVRTGIPSVGTGISIVITVSYSLDGGATFTTIYTVGAARAVTVDSVSLPLAQNLAQLRVKVDLASTTSASIVEVDFYEAWVIGVE
jgi:hypothetical protein